MLELSRGASHSQWSINETQNIDIFLQALWKKKNKTLDKNGIVSCREKVIPSLIQYFDSFNREKPIVLSSIKNGAPENFDS